MCQPVQLSPGQDCSEDATPGIHKENQVERTQKVVKLAIISKHIEY